MVLAKYLLRCLRFSVCLILLRAEVWLAIFKIFSFYYGLLACGHRATKLNRAKALLGLAPVTTTKVREPYDVLLQRLTGKDIHVCPSCGGRLRRQRDLAPTIGPARGQDPPLACEAA
jgi:hypothetical protein